MSGLPSLQSVAPCRRCGRTGYAYGVAQPTPMRCAGCGAAYIGDPRPDGPVGAVVRPNAPTLPSAATAALLATRGDHA